jgi:hypothetical protein
MVGVLALALVLVYVLGRGKPSVSEDEAVSIARPQIDFVPEAHQIRFMRRGIPPHGFWVVSFFTRKRAGGYDRVTVVLVDASSGRVSEVRRTS